MERDSLLAHGTSYLLQDRLLNCSDYTQSYVCSHCGSILSVISVNETSTRVPSGVVVGGVRSDSGGVSINSSLDPSFTIESGPFWRQKPHVYCVTCDSESGVRVIEIPFVFRYLATELMAMGVRLVLSVKD